MPRAEAVHRMAAPTTARTPDPPAGQTADRRAWLLCLAAVAIPWAYVGLGLYESYHPWREHTTLARQALLMALPAAGTLLSIAWAVFGLLRAGVQRAWMWALPLLVVVLAAQVALAWRVLGGVVAPT